MLYTIVEAELRAGYRVWIRFQDGVEGEVDLGDLVGRGVFGRWQDEAEFSQLRIDPDSWTLAWPGGLDLAPDALYQELAGTRLS